MTHQQSERATGGAAMFDDGAAEPPTVAPLIQGPAPVTPPYDRVDDCGEASFPSSDPPSWWSGR